MHRYLWPISGMLAAVLAGVAILMSPFALHLNHGGAWTKATDTMFWSGLGLIVVALAAAFSWQRDLTGQLAVAKGELQPASQEVLASEAGQGASPTEADGEEPDWEAQLAKLAETVLQDLKTETTSSPEPAEDASQDLQAVASALLQDLSHRMENAGVDGGRGGRY